MAEIKVASMSHAAIVVVIMVNGTIPPNPQAKRKDRLRLYKPMRHQGEAEVQSSLTGISHWLNNAAISLFTCVGPHALKSLTATRNV